MKPCASDCPKNAIFSRDFMLFFNQQNQTLVCKAIKKCVLKHAAAWSNPTNVGIGVFFDNPPFPLSAVLAAELSLPSRVHTLEMLWIQEPSTIIHFFPGKANVDFACSIVMCDLRGPSTITVVLANISLANCQLSWKVR